MIKKKINNLGERFAEILKRKNLNDSSLGKIAGVTGTAIKNIIKNGTTPKVDVIFNISSKLGVSYDWILEGLEPFERVKKESSEVVSKGEYEALVGYSFPEYAILLKERIRVADELEALQKQAIQHLEENIAMKNEIDIYKKKLNIA